MNESDLGRDRVGPRPHMRSIWLKRRSGHRSHGLAWMLDHTFALRLLLSLIAAGVLLGGVNRWENCRAHGFQQGCLLADAGGIVTVSNVEALSIITAAMLYLLEGRTRRQRENLEAMEVILSCQQAGVRLSHARNDALEKLCARELWLDGLDLSRTWLQQLVLPHARLREVSLRDANLQGCCLQDADLQGSDLRNADLSHCDLRHADLRGADLRGAILRKADLRGTDLRGARREGAVLDGALLENTAWEEQEPGTSDFV